MEKENKCPTLIYLPPPPRTSVLSAKAWRTLAALLLCLLVFAPSLPAQAQAQLNYRNFRKTANSIELEIIPVPGVAVYKVTEFLHVRTRRFPGKPQTGGPYRAATCIVEQPSDNEVHLTSGTGMRWFSPDALAAGLQGAASYANNKIKWCRLKPNTEHRIVLEAYDWRSTTYNGEVYKSMRLIARRVLTVRTNPAQGAPPDPPTATPVDILIGIGVHSSTEATLSWNAISGATGYLLEYSGGNNESGVFNLGAGATNQRVTGLTPGGSYDVYLTVYMQDGAKAKGVGFFVMPAPAPTNTPLPPPPPTNTPVPPPPPTNTPIPPPPPTNTPVRLGSSSEDSQQQPSGPYASLIQTLLTYQAETQHGKPHVERWTRALAALGWGSHANPMTLTEAQQMAQQFSSSRWQPVVAALTQLQPPPTNTPIPPPPPTNTPIPPPPPTNTPIPPPPPTNTPIPPPPTAVPPTPVPQQPSYTVPQSLIDTLKGYEAETQHGPEHVRRWTRALAALGHGSGDPMSLSEAKDMARQFSANRWNPVIDALEKLAGN